RIPSSRIVLFGESLGGAIAIDQALRAQSSGSPAAGLVVQSSFTSIPDMAASVIPHFPGILLRTKMNSLDKIKSVSCPKLFIHSRADNIVPFEMGERLFAAAPQPKEFYEVIGARHNETEIIGGSPYLNAILRFVRSLEPAVPLQLPPE
ncbi:MAG TPA: alpha/beta hydrolase, partial [Blastocatellia bacterium]